MFGIRSCLAATAFLALRCRRPGGGVRHAASQGLRPRMTSRRTCRWTWTG